MTAVSLQTTPRRLPVTLAAPALALLLWLGLVAAWQTWGGDRSLCTFRNVTGVPCPTCGSTRAAQAALDGRLLDALALNPLMALATMAAAGWAVLRFGFARRVRVQAGPRGWALLGTAVVLLLVANWIWVIARETIHPS